MHKKYLILLLVVSFLIAWFLWPLASSSYEMKVNTPMFEEKQAFLRSSPQIQEVNGPNIILITVDDLGMAVCSLYDEGDITTPNIDRLGEEGVIFENAYVTSPVCAPSRAALITGRYQQRFGFEFTMHERYLKNRLEYIGFRYFVDSYPWKPQWADAVPCDDAIQQQGLPLSEITLADVLKANGYKTGIIGKWHLGWSTEKRPAAFGFDYQYGFFNSHSLYIPEGSEGFVDQKIEEDWTDPHIWSGQRNGSHAIHRNGKAIEEKGYLTDRITEESVDIIENWKHDPFFLWISYNAPHTPLQAPEEYVSKFSHIQDPVKRLYRAMISNLDDNIGRLISYLAENQLDTNTVLVFISDNGGAEYTLTTDNGRYQGGKNTEFEGGIKVPMIIRWTGKINQGQRFQPMVSSLDIFPTVLDVIDGINTPERPIDGINLMPYLMGYSDGNPHDFLFWKRGNSRVIRSNRWKMMINTYSGDTLLYNLKKNRYEYPDEFGLYPDIVKDLSTVLGEWMKTHKPPMWPPVVYYIGEKEDESYYFDQ